MNTIYTVPRTGLAIAFLAVLTGCTTYYVQQPQPQAYTPPPPPPPAPVYVQPAPPPPPAPAVVVIQREEDFYEPLSPYGEWVVVGSYGRCWRPSRVEIGWRPYASGHWELTDDGWYWASDEPWGWATYHYGRWVLDPSYGWIWAPQTEWAPAWVTWREGGGYVGWAPLPPERAGISVSIAIVPAAFCFVEERRIHEPVRPTSVIVNQTTIINKTVVINKTKIVNKVVVNEGPRADEVERATGQKFQKVSLSDLRHRDEEPIAQTHQNLRAKPQRQPEPRKVEAPQNLPNPVQGNPPPANPPVKREVEKPPQKEPRHPEPVTAKQPENVPPQPAPENIMRQPADNGNKHERQSRQNPTVSDQQPAAPDNQTPPNVKNNRRQPNPRPEVQPVPQQPGRQRANGPENPTAPSGADQARNPKAKVRNRDVNNTNTTDNAAQRNQR
jgi:hypothetical protein